MAGTLSPDNAGIALAGNALATAAMLVVLILIYGPVSGAHFNPAVILAFTLRRNSTEGEAAAYVVVQVVGAPASNVLTHVMFDQPLLLASRKAGAGVDQWTGKLVARSLWKLPVLAV